MKKKLFMAMTLILSMSSMVFAQTQKGNWILSGNSSLQVSSTKPEKGESTTTVILNPSVGYFVANNLAVGAGVSLRADEGSTHFSVLPTASYFFESQSQVKPFAQLGIGYSSISNGDNTYGGLALGAGAGIVYLLNRNVGINLGLQYMRSDYDGAINNTLGGIIGLSVFF